MIKKLFIFIIGLFLIFPVFTDEVITGFEEEDLPVLNEELRQLGKDILWKKEDEDVKLETAEDIDFQQKEVQSFVIENRTSDPSSPVEAQIWYRSDL